MANRIKCIYCGKPIHINDFGGIKKEGLFCNDSFCIAQLLREEAIKQDAKHKSSGVKKW